MKILVVLFYFCPLLVDASISENKCQEYGKAVYSSEEGPVMMRSFRKNNVSNCGIESVPLIIGGKKATPKEFPHMALIGFGNSPQAEIFWDCGGALISENFILTAGHCTVSRERGLSQKVKLGIISLTQDDEHKQERGIVQRVTHPNYTHKTKYNDIALLKMDRPVDFTPFVRPACLTTTPMRENMEVIAIGFGKTSFEASTGSKFLLKVQLEIFNPEKCAESFGSGGMSPLKEGMKDSMICAGHSKGGKDTCQGDSGGPIQTVLASPYCMYSIVGITSFGKFCGFAESPAIYTQVASYIPWIESIVWR